MPTCLLPTCLLRMASCCINLFVNWVGGLCGESDATGPSIFARMHNGASTRLEAAMAAQNWLRPPRQRIERFSPQNGPVGQARNDGSCQTQFCDPKNFECFGEFNGLRPGTVPPDSPGDVLYGKLAFLKPVDFICESFAALVQGDMANVAPMETHSTMEMVHEEVGVHEFQGYSQEEQYCPTGQMCPDGSTTIADFAGGNSVKGGNQVEQICPTGYLCPTGSMATVRKPSMDYCASCFRGGELPGTIGQADGNITPINGMDMQMWLFSTGIEHQPGPGPADAIIVPESCGALPATQHSQQNSSLRCQIRGTNQSPTHRHARWTQA